MATCKCRRMDLGGINYTSVVVGLDGTRFTREYRWGPRVFCVCRHMRARPWGHGTCGVMGGWCRSRWRTYQCTMYFYGYDACDERACEYTQRCAVRREAAYRGTDAERADHTRMQRSPQHASRNRIPQELGHDQTHLVPLAAKTLCLGITRKTRHCKSSRTCKGTPLASLSERQKSPTR